MKENENENVGINLARILLSNDVDKEWAILNKESFNNEKASIGEGLSIKEGCDSENGYLNGTFNLDTIKRTITSDKVYIFTTGVENNRSAQMTELQAKAKTNILGLKKTRVELIDLTGKEIVNDIPPYNYSEVQQGSYKMNYINYDFDYNTANSDFISAGVSVLEIKNKDVESNEKLGIVVFAYSYDDDLDNLGRYMTDGLLEIYQAGYSDNYTIINFHTAVEGFNPTKKYATVLAGIVD